MPLPTVLPAPRAVRIAGVIVALEGLTGLVFAVAVLIRAFGVTTGAGNLYGEFGYYLVIAVAMLAVAGGLLLGYRWSRTPAAVVQVLLIAVAWYAIGPTKLVVPAIITVVLCVAALVLLFTAPSRAWAVRDPEA
ncbi:MAG TPA: hypothetical protein VHF06_10370 [Pseudonocardiaceae bacterium]|nr:hypothetical protein [Pseudonocardiaceae bacterium]